MQQRKHKIKKAWTKFKMYVGCYSIEFPPAQAYFQVFANDYSPFHFKNLDKNKSRETGEIRIFLKTFSATSIFSRCPRPRLVAGNVSRHLLQSCASVFSLCYSSVELSIHLFCGFPLLLFPGNIFWRNNLASAS